MFLGAIDSQHQPCSAVRRPNADSKPAPVFQLQTSFFHPITSTSPDLLQACLGDRRGRVAAAFDWARGMLRKYAPEPTRNQCRDTRPGSRWSLGISGRPLEMHGFGKLRQAVCCCCSLTRGQFRPALYVQKFQPRVSWESVDESYIHTSTLSEEISFQQGFCSLTRASRS